VKLFHEICIHHATCNISVVINTVVLYEPVCSPLVKLCYHYHKKTNSSEHLKEPQHKMLLCIAIYPRWASD